MSQSSWQSIAKGKHRLSYEVSRASTEFIFGNHEIEISTLS